MHRIYGYRFGPFFLNTRDGQLFYNSQLTDLSHTHCAVLALLIRNRGHVVEKNQMLFESGWAETALYTHIHQIKKALVDVNSTQPNYWGECIETHRKQGRSYEGGYSFRKVEVKEENGDDSEITRRSSSQIVTANPSGWTSNVLEPNVLWGGIEAGGSKFIVAVGTDGSDIHKREVIQVQGERSNTIKKVVAFFKKYEERLAGVGIGSFGPLGLNKKNNQDFGKILSTTPKIGWEGYRILADMTEKLRVPISLTQNVNASLVGEVEFGIGKDKALETCVYLTVGAGIGAGIMANGDFIRGLGHPELGHILVPRADGERKGFYGKCPMHKGCLEGMASGTAIKERWDNTPGEQLSNREDVWDLEACYLAYGIVTIILTLMPELIILGGAVMGAPGLLRKIHSEVEKNLGRYIKEEKIDNNIEDYIVMPALKGKDGVYESGIRGAILLAQKEQGLL